MNIYFSGIGGVGIGPLAEIAKDAGYTVHGSDLTDSLITSQLREKGIEIELAQDGSFLESVHQKTPLDWFIYTAALPADHAELVLAQQLGIKTAKRDEFLAHLLREHNLKLIAISGTHGKTTTTGMMVWALKQLNVPVSYAVGTTLSFGPSGKFDPESEYFVYECDEFDRNFLHFSPYLSLITSIDYDHPDTYPTEREYKLAFHQFIDQSGHVIIWQNDTDYLETAAGNLWELREADSLPLALPGAHNRRNGTLVVKGLEYLGIGDQAAQETALAAFPGTDRRFEKLADNLYTDYGHHPVEIAATLQLAREVSDGIVLVYQPHQNVRQHEIRDQYTDDIFKDASEVYWLPTYQSREDPNLAILSPDELTKDLASTTVHVAELDDTLWNEIQKARDAGKLVLCMGAGTIDGWVRKCLAVKRVAATFLLTSSGTLLLQHRDDRPDINAPNLLTGFGGSVEGDESNREAAARELREETNLKFDETDLKYLLTVYQPTNLDGNPRFVTYYTLDNVSSNGLEIYEGQGYKEVDLQEDLTKLPLSSASALGLGYLKS